MDIDKIAEMNIQFNKDKKELEKYKSEIKKALNNMEGILYGEKYDAIVTAREGESLNNEKAVEVAKKLGAKWLIKTIEVIDEKELEDAFATGEIDAKEFSDCIDTKTTYVLNFKAKKGEK